MADAVKTYGRRGLSAVLLISMLLTVIAVSVMVARKNNSPKSLTAYTNYNNKNNIDDKQLSNYADYEASAFKNAEANNRKLSDEEQKTKREYVKTISDISIDNPSATLPKLKMLLDAPNELASVKLIAISKLIEMDTAESLALVVAHINSDNSYPDWIGKTAAALLVKADTVPANDALAKLKQSATLGMLEFLDKFTE